MYKVTELKTNYEILLPDLTSKPYTADLIHEIRAKLATDEYFQASLLGWRLLKQCEKGNWWTHYTGGMPPLIESHRFTIEGFKVKEVILPNRAPKHNHFFTRGEAEAALKERQARYAEAKIKAEALLDEKEGIFLSALSQVDVHYRVTGDTYGVDFEGYYITVHVDGFEFERKVED